MDLSTKKMAQYQITYGVGGGYNDITEEVLEFNTQDEADEYAYNSAVGVYESYGVFENEHVYDEYDSAEDCEDALLNSIESWCDYGATLIG